jgi:hypothetical protein
MEEKFIIPNGLNGQNVINAINGLLRRDQCPEGTIIYIFLNKGASQIQLHRTNNHFKMIVSGGNQPIDMGELHLDGLRVITNSSAVDTSIFTAMSLTGSDNPSYFATLIRSEVEES